MTKLSASAAKIRVASEDDAERLAALAAATFTDTFGHLYPPEDLRAHLSAFHTADAFRALLKDASTRLWVAEVDACWVGYAQAGPCKLPHPAASPQHGELMRLYVVPPQKGTGLAQALMAEAIAWMERTFRGPLWVGVYSENFRAQRFYARFGFQNVGEYEFPVGRVRDRELILRRDAAWKQGDRSTAWASAVS